MQKQGVAAFDQVEGHRPAHDSEPDKSDRCHRFSPEGLAPLGLLTCSLARRCAGALRSRGSLARALATEPLVFLPRGLRPLGLLTCSLARRCAGALRSRGSLARALATEPLVFLARGLRAPR